MKSIARVRIMFLCVFLLSTCCFYLFRQRDNDVGIREESKHSFMEGGVYSRDHKGYLYPKEYFQILPPHQTNLFHNISLLIGRHSDTVLPVCRHPDGNNPDNVKAEYKMTGQFEYLDNFKNPCWFEYVGSNKTLQCIPYYYFIGTPKAGSSDLFWRIRMHPDVAPYSVKEQRWFGSFRFRSQDDQDISSYTHRFDRASMSIRQGIADSAYHSKIIGDGSPSYLFNNDNWHLLPGNEGCLEPRVMTVSYIHNLFPSAKLILIVRNPVDRLYSDYLYNSKRTGASKTAEEFHSWAKTTLANYQNCFKELPFRYCLYSRKLKYQSMVHSFTASIYSRLLLDALRIFPRDQILVLQMEDYSTNMVQRLEDVFEFLGLDRLPAHRMKEITEIKQYNEGKFYQKSGPMLPVTRKMIYSFYKPFNEELAQILNDDKYLWPEE